MYKKCIIGFIGVFFLIVFFNGCVSWGTFSNTKYLDESIPPTEHSMLYFDETLEVTVYDDFQSRPGLVLGEFKSFSSGNDSHNVISFLPPGTHKFSIDYTKMLGSSYSSAGTAINYEQAKNLVLIYDFHPGRLYYIYPAFNNNVVSIEVLDVTDSTDQHFIDMKNDSTQLIEQM